MPFLQQIQQSLSNPKQFQNSFFSVDIRQENRIKLAMLQNPNPIIHDKLEITDLYEEYIRRRQEADPNGVDEFDALEIFELLRNITDPEHPLTLEELNIVSLENISVDDKKSRIKILYTPTIPHCSVANIIGLMIRVKLLRSLPMRFKVDVSISKGTHQQEDQINKQLAGINFYMNIQQSDKERVAAALENPHIMEVINRCLQDSSYVD